jgi:hypothetical protein
MITNFGIGTLGRELVKANVKSKAPPRLIFARGPLILTFAREPAEPGSEC